MVSGLHSCHENPGAAEPPPSGPHALGLWVPKTSSTSCDLRVFIDDAAKAIAPLDVEMI
jgi:hypothetical protein